MDTTQDINTVEWFFGYGGNHLGLKRVLPNLRLLAACEIEEFAVENILAKMEAGLLEAAPIWSDCKTFPWEPFVDRTHLFVASYPCQPFSAAGKRQGTEDERHLWPYVYRWILRARPLLVFLENVEGHVSLGLSTVISDLEEGGYKATWGIFSASEVGAPHQRKRVFILAYRHGERGQLPDWWRVAAEQVPVGHGETRRDELMANAVCERRQQDARGASCHEEANGREGWDVQQQDGYHVAASHVQGTAWPSRPGEQQHAWEPPRVVANTGSAERWPRAAAGDITDGTAKRQEEAGWPSQPSDQAMGNANELRSQGRHDTGSLQAMGISRAELAGDGGEPMADSDFIGLQDAADQQRHQRTGDDAVIGAARVAEGGRRQTQPPLGRDPNGPAHRLDDAELYTTCDNRTDELRLLGNGVVPACAERAFRVLVGELIQHANQ